jgi:hypothetical protein
VKSIYHKELRDDLRRNVLNPILDNNDPRVASRVEGTWDWVWDEVTSYVAVRTTVGIEYLDG